MRLWILTVLLLAAIVWSGVVVASGPRGGSVFCAWGNEVVGGRCVHDARCDRASAWSLTCGPATTYPGGGVKVYDFR